MSMHTSMSLEQIEEQAADWFSLVSAGNPSAQQREQFQQWLQASDLHEQTYREFTQLWGTLAALPEDAYSAAPETPAQSNVTSMLTWLPTKLFRPQAIAACLAVLCVATGIAFYTQPHDIQRYETTMSEIREVKLEDGSRITLSALSAVDVDITGNKRIITLLQGQAYFKVTTQYRRDGSKLPFEIQSQDMRINVLGTEFEVNSRDNSSAVTVSEGRVRVTTQNDLQGVLLEQGQAVAVVGPKRNRLGKVKSVDVDSIASWRSGRLVFLDAKLEEVLSDARRFHKGGIFLDDETLAEHRITTSFNIDEIPNLALILENILPVTVSISSSGRILITPNAEASVGAKPDGEASTSVDYGI